MARNKKLLSCCLVLCLLFVFLIPAPQVWAVSTEFAFNNSAPTPITVGQKYKFDIHALAPRDFSWVDPVGSPDTVTFIVYSGAEAGQSVAGKAEIFVNKFGNMITFKPDQRLKFNTFYQLRVPAGVVQDNNTGELNAEWNQLFITSMEGDMSLNSPVLSPFHNSTAVPINTTVVLDFGEIVYTNTAAMQGIDFVDSAGNKVIFDVISTPENTGFILTPFVVLAKNTVYTLTIPTNTIEDNEQNPNTGPIKLTFTTGNGTYPIPKPPSGTNPSGPNLPDPVFLNVIEVTPDLFNLSAGETVQITAVGRYNDGEAYNITSGVTWTTSDPQIVKVSVAGLVTAVGSGKALITAGLFGLKKQISINVTDTSGNQIGQPVIVKPDEDGTYDFNDKLNLELERGSFADEIEVVVNEIGQASEVGQTLAKKAKGFADQLVSIYEIQIRDKASKQRLVKLSKPIKLTLKVDSWINKGLYGYDSYYQALVPLKSTYNQQSRQVTADLANLNILAVITEKGSPFSDLGRVLWAKDFINLLSRKNIINGVGKGKFNPDAPLTRGEMAKIMAISAGVPGESGSGFMDLPNDFWATPFISSVKKAGIIDGYPDGKFKANNPVTRAEMVKMVMEAFNVEIEDTNNNSFRDKGHWADQYIATAVKKGIISGYPDGTFKPDRYITRAEAAKVIAKAYSLF